jgi:hypothetical protein
MELQQRIEMIDTLLEDAGQKMQALDRALAATDVTQEPSENPETKMINAERHLLEKACQDLQRLRTMFEDLEESERLRGVSM